MTELAMAPAPRIAREAFGAGVVASTVLHTTLLSALLFGGMLFKTPRSGIPEGKGGAIIVSLSGGEGIPLPWRPTVKSNALPSETPGDKIKETAPEPSTPTKKGPKASREKATAPTPKGPKNPNAIPLAGTMTKVSPEPDAAPQPPGPATTANAANSTPAGSSGLVGNGSSPDIQRGGGGGGISNGNGSTDAMFGETGFDFTDYARRLKQAISPYFEPPVGTRGRSVTIKLMIAKDGTASEIEIERKSRNDALDTAARRAVNRAALEKRIPPLPDSYRKSPNIHATLIFESER